MIENISSYKSKIIEAFIRYHRNIGDVKMPPVQKVFRTYNNGELSKTVTIVTDYHITSNEYADVLQLELFLRNNKKIKL